MSDRSSFDQGIQHDRSDDPPPKTGTDPLELLEQCLASFADGDPRQKLLYKLRHAVILSQAASQQRELEFKKVSEVVAKLTAPANRIGTLLEIPAAGLARIVVGGAEYYANVDPRVSDADLRIGTQILVNEAYAVIRTLGYDRNGPILKLAETLPDGRLRFEQDMGRQSLMLQRSTDLLGVELSAGDHIRIDPSLRIALEKLVDRKASRHVLDETPKVTWEQIGGQSEAITAIRKAIEYPLVHAETFERFKFSQPKGFLLYGPPGCGKTLIGQAAAGSLAKRLSESQQGREPDQGNSPPVTSGAFLHVKGPEILNMWLGESERMVRDLFAQARARRKEGALPFIFIDEAESIVGTRRAMRSFNISNTLVPMFCSEMDGIESLRDVVIILASNRPDLIDPAVLRPGRIDRKIKVGRPNKAAAAEILKVYLTADLPLDPKLVKDRGGEPVQAVVSLVEDIIEMIFRRTEETRLLSIRLRNGQSTVLYRGDLVSGAILASIVQRAKEKAIDRMIQSGQPAGLLEEDLRAAVSEEFREGDMLPPDDAAEEWLKLLDHHPEQVVGISSFRRGRQAEERLTSQII
ncbi:MAG: peptidase [Nitrospira sp. HN-bin3]|uniref:AAA family ATPase n=1 Tax=Nitrospira cf. moscoviensis SBR1015 TaxID=96242 RepID=UPI000A0CEAF6|nr:AAA family ATPase [Nitrospira cf. moscoviensis SBR1015]OQW31905.1 MAG: peptidase [Nitrospira sp. HN-bin3]